MYYKLNLHSFTNKGVSGLFTVVVVPFGMITSHINTVCSVVNIGRLSATPVRGVDSLMCVSPHEGPFLAHVIRAYPSCTSCGIKTVKTRYFSNIVHTKVSSWRMSFAPIHPILPEDKNQLKPVIFQILSTRRSLPDACR